MSIQVISVSADEAQILEGMGEGQFCDVKAIEISPAKLTRAMSAFANSDGGDLYIGIDELLVGGGVKKLQWRGFNDVEAANGHLQAFEKFFPLGTGFQYEFLKCDKRTGLVLHVQISRNQQVVKASDDTPYIRRGAQCLPVQTADALKRLQYTKGVSSFENEPVNTSKDNIVDSPVLAGFIQYVVPSANPERWLTKQGLLVDSKPTVGGLLLFAEEPQAAMPKRCGVKLYRYKTREAEGFRDVLAGDPITIEGPLYDQIRNSVAKTIEITESIPKMGATGLEKVSYPKETLHEIIANALIHRDYSVADDVHIRIFDNRIEVQSPGRLPAHVTVKKILNERFARNGAIVRLLNKFPDPPNKDVGEGLNTAFAKMKELGLKEPVIDERDADVLVVIRHEALASPQEAIMTYLESNPSINNRRARELTGVRMDYQMKSIFGSMEDAGMIERVPGTNTASTAYQKKIH
jgi:ATP-dependent DNA helicase RecG